jgi:hypothetical protein
MGKRANLRFLNEARRYLISHLRKGGYVVYPMSKQNVLIIAFAEMYGYQIHGSPKRWFIDFYRNEKNINPDSVRGFKGRTKKEIAAYKKEYHDYLKSKEWRNIRLRLLAERGEVCQRCGKSCDRRYLHIHHLTYDRIFKEEPGDLLILCIDCHRKEHGRK